MYPSPLKHLTGAALAALLLCGLAHAQVYRSVDASGKVTFTDMPPEAAATGGQSTAPASASATGSGLPYELQQTASRYPVTLYSNSACAPCDDGRSMLSARGIPFTEKTVETNADIQALQQLAGSAELPVLYIGQQRLMGYSQPTWVRYLDAAGYPKTSQLPARWQAPAATPLVAAAQVAEQPNPTAAAASDPNAIAVRNSEPSIAPEITDSNPQGIRF